MATPAVRAKGGICPEKRTLLNAFIETVQDLMRLQNREMVFVAESGQVLERFDIALERARTNREKARHLYFSHIRLHGC